eukprot:570840-Pelagomonas_calceolata.AAC.4
MVMLCQEHTIFCIFTGPSFCPIPGSGGYIPSVLVQPTAGGLGHGGHASAFLVQVRIVHLVRARVLVPPLPGIQTQRKYIWADRRESYVPPLQKLMLLRFCLCFGVLADAT